LLLFITKWTEAPNSRITGVYYTGLFEMIVGVLTTCQFGTNSIIVLLFVESQMLNI